MVHCESGNPRDNTDGNNCSDADLIDRIEEAYKTYKLSEMFLNDVIDDYGKQKIAELRMEFARHHLLTLMGEARGRGIKWKNNEIIRRYLYPDP